MLPRIVTFPLPTQWRAGGCIGSEILSTKGWTGRGIAKVGWNLGISGTMVWIVYRNL
jgi:hypothetical protein